MSPQDAAALADAGLLARRVAHPLQGVGPTAALRLESEAGNVLEVGALRLTEAWAVSVLDETARGPVAEAWHVVLVGEALSGDGGEAFRLYRPVAVERRSPVHRLTVSRPNGTTEYDLRHEGCAPGSDVRAFSGEEDQYGSRSWPDCPVAGHLESVGFLEGLGVETWDGGGRTVRHLGDGEYDVSYWCHVTPASPSGPEDYDAGLTVTAR